MKMILEGDGWDNLEEIILFGYGRQGRKALETFQKDFQIKAIIENDRLKTGMNIEGIPVIHFEDISIDLLKKYKIIVTTSERYYCEIAQQLMALDLVENKDFVMYQKFIIEWYFRFMKKLYIPKTDLPITPYCSLNCEKCHVFIPYWKNKIEYDLNLIKDSLDLFFRYVDYVIDMDLLGGEPLISHHIDDVLIYVGEKYRNQIGYLGIITNGTIVPKEQTLKLLQQYNVRVSISDYSKELHYEKKVEDLCKMLDSHGIKFIRNSNITWFDFGNPCGKPKYIGDDAKRHMECCNTIYHVIHEKKFYCCGTAWAAQKSGLFPPSEYGYVDLDDLGRREKDMKEEIMKCSLGDVNNGYLDFCQVCGGFGIDNINVVPTAKQLI